jgi:uncharacterized damage-inducible protein DinB
MSMRDHVLAVYRFNLWMAKKAVEDLTDEQMTQQPRPGMNHAAWILGHLAMERVFLRDLLGIGQSAPEGWAELFMTGTKPVAEAGKYPPKAELLAKLEETHALVEEAFRKVSDEDLDRETPHERLRQRFPKVGDVVVGLMTSHAGSHLGQLSAWRRAMGIKSIF